MVWYVVFVYPLNCRGKLWRAIKLHTQKMVISLEIRPLVALYPPHIKMCFIGLQSVIILSLFYRPIINKIKYYQLCTLKTGGFINILNVLGIKD